MHSKGALWAIVILTTLCAPQARADTAEVTSAVRCVIVALRMGQVPGVAAQTAGMMTMFHYLGRLDSEVGKLSTDDLKSEAARCGKKITEKGEELQVIGQHLVERGKQLQLERAAEEAVRLHTLGTGSRIGARQPSRALAAWGGLWRGVVHLDHGVVTGAGSSGTG